MSHTFCQGIRKEFQRLDVEWGRGRSYSTQTTQTVLESHIIKTLNFSTERIESI